MESKNDQLEKKNLKLLSKLKLLSDRNKKDTTEVQTRVFAKVFQKFFFAFLKKSPKK